MNKKLKKMLATIFALAVCSVSVVSICTSAVVGIKGGKYPNQYTTSFTAYGEYGDIKYNFWQAGTDFFELDGLRVFISSEPITSVDVDTGEEMSYYKTVYVRTYMINDENGGEIPFTEVHGGNGIGEFSHFYSIKGDVNEDNLPLVEKYLLKNSISYTKKSIEIGDRQITSIDFDTDNMSLDEMAELATKIRKYSGWSFANKVFPSSLGNFNITDVVNALPEVTLAGDANEDGEVNISDAVLIMQSIANPEEFELTWQGMANADIYGDGDGVTLMDAFTIQEMSLNKSNA